MNCRSDITHLLSNSSSDTLSPPEHGDAVDGSQTRRRWPGRSAAEPGPVHPVSRGAVRSSDLRRVYFALCDEATKRRAHHALIWREFSR